MRSALPERFFRVLGTSLIVGLQALALMFANHGSALSASFNCQKASTFIEHAICSDARLSSLDDRLATAYDKAKSTSLDLQKLARDERAWIALRNSCTALSCIANAMEFRIAELGADQQPRDRTTYFAEPRSTGAPSAPGAVVETNKQAAAIDLPRAENVLRPVPQPASMPAQSSPVVALQNDAAETRGMIALFGVMVAEQRAMVRPNDPAEVAQQAVQVLTERMKELQSQFQEKTTQLSAYSTSIRPNDPDLQITARRASELFPKIPFYIPGTTETGEFWLEPTVSKTGVLLFNLKFIDPLSKDRVRDTVELSSEQLELARDAIQKLVGWSKTAHDRGIHQVLSQRAVCFPKEGCPEEGAKLDKAASTEIIFKIYEDGATAGRLQINKGRFESGYNISTDSALLLQAYLNHVLLEGRKEFDAGSRDASQLRELFK